MSPRAGSTYEQGRHVRISKDAGKLMDRIAEKAKWSYKTVVEEALDRLAREQGVKRTSD